MPIVKIEQINEDTKILIWYIQEDQSFFESHLRHLYELPFPWETMNHKRRREFLATRYLIQLGLPPGVQVNELTKDQNGCPRISNPEIYLGISHTKEYVGCVISNRPTGCDIEHYQPRIIRLSHRFMTEEDLRWAEDHNQLMKTHLMWGIKESAYKTWGKKRIDWNRHIHIDPIDWNAKKGKFKGSIGNESGRISFLGEYEYFPDFLFVWTIQQ